MRHCAPLSLYFVHFPALRSCLAFALADAHSLSFSASIDARRIHDDWAHNKNGKNLYFSNWREDEDDEEEGDTFVQKTREIWIWRFRKARQNWRFKKFHWLISTGFLQKIIL